MHKIIRRVMPRLGGSWALGIGAVAFGALVSVNASAFDLDQSCKAGASGWADADMLEVGLAGLTLAEQRTHFALWCLIKSPLLIGADVRTIAQESLAILKNAGLIAVNQ